MVVLPLFLVLFFWVGPLKAEVKELVTLTELEKVEYRCYDLMRQGKSKQVYALCNDALKKYPKSGMLYYWRARSWGGGADESLKDYDRAVRYNYKYKSHAYYYKAQYQDFLKNYDEAVETVMLAVRSEHHKMDLFKQRIRMEMHRTLQNIDKVNPELEKHDLLQFWQYGMYGEGLLFADKLLKVFPNQPDLLYAKAMLQWGGHLFDDALLTFDLALKNGYKYAGQLLYDKAQCYRRAGRLKEAFKTVDLAIERGFEHQDAYLFRQQILTTFAILKKKRKFFSYLP